MIQKNKLLELGVFIDNIYLVKYLQIINNPKESKNYSEHHHIIPKSYYRHNHLPIDNSKSNIVRLSCLEHCLAHWYLFNCTIGKLKTANFRALLYLIASKNCDYKIDTMSEQDIIVLAELRMAAIKTGTANYFTDIEIKFLEKYYEDFGGAYCAKKLNRSASQIYIKASQLGLHTNKVHHPLAWAQDEDKILYEYYPIEGTAVSKRLIKRTGYACRSRAKELGITRFWTTDDIEILKKYFPAEGQNVYKHFAGRRSKDACRRMAYKLGLFSSHSWTKKDCAILCHKYAIEKCQIKELMQVFPGRTRSSIVGKLKYLGVWHGANKKKK